MANGTTESLPSGLDQLVQYNAQEQYNSPHPNSYYNSPTPAMSPYSSCPDPSQMVSGSNPCPSLAVDVEMKEVRSSPRFVDACDSMSLSDRAAANMAAQNSGVYTSTPNTTPRSPRNSMARTTRSGRRIGEEHLRPRSAGVQKSKPKKKKNPTQESTVAAALTVLLADLDPAMDVDIGAYVNRTVATRRKERDDSKDGRVKRPMNAFMLYRKGFQHRIKEMLKNENHQRVSKVAGDGWGLESKEVHKQFNDWSQIERQLHTEAFPDYKFQPTKSKNAQKPAVMSDGEEPELPEDWSGTPTLPPWPQNCYAPNDDPDADYQPPGCGSNSVYSSYPQNSMSPTPYPESPYRHNQSLPPPVNMSQFQYSNPNKPLPNPYPTNGGGQYPAQTIDIQQHQMPHNPSSYAFPPPSFQMENLYYRRSDAPPQHHFTQQTPPLHQQHSYAQQTSPPPQQYHYTQQTSPPPQQHHYTQQTPPPSQYRQQYAEHNQNYQQIGMPFQAHMQQLYHHPPTQEYQHPPMQEYHQQQPIYEAPPHGEVVPHAQPPSGRPVLEGVGNFDAALAEMGESGDQFQLGPEDLAFEPIFSIDDGDNLIDPSLVNDDWANESDPPNEFLDMKCGVVVAAEPVPEPTPEYSPSHTPALAPTPVPLV